MYRVARAVGIAMVLVAVVVGPVLAARLWSLTGSPTTLTTGVATHVDLTMKNMGGGGGGDEIACVTVLVPSAFSISSVSIQSLPSGYTNWVTSMAAASGGVLVKLREPKDKQPLVGDPFYQEAVLRISGTPTSAGAQVWEGRASDKPDCKTGAFPVETVTVVVNTRRAGAHSPPAHSDSQLRANADAHSPANVPRRLRSQHPRHHHLRPRPRRRAPHRHPPPRRLALWAGRRALARRRRRRRRQRRPTHPARQSVRRPRRDPLRCLRSWCCHRHDPRRMGAPEPVRARPPAATRSSPRRTRSSSRFPATRRQTSRHRSSLTMRRPRGWCRVSSRRPLGSSSCWRWSPRWRTPESGCRWRGAAWPLSGHLAHRGPGCAPVPSSA